MTTADSSLAPGAAPWLVWTEPTRAIAELAAYLATPPTPPRGAPGNGHAVMVLPGFMAGDWSTSVLRTYLRLFGYTPVPWGFGRNLGPVDGLMARLAGKVTALAEQFGEPLSLVGHSLGGIYAREIARALPDAVSLVVTLGSPFRCADGSGANPAVVRLLEMTTGCTLAELRDRGFGDIHEPLPVPGVAIYSKQDGVADWRCCMDNSGPNAENVEVQGSHCGMLVNPAVLSVVADRLGRRRVEA